VSTSEEGRSYHHGDLRAALLRAALELLAERGEAGISLREVARRAEVSHNAPYRHFADREALLAALAEQGFSELLVRLQVAADGLAAAQRLAALGRCYVAYALEQRGLFRLMFASALERGRYQTPPLPACRPGAWCTVCRSCCWMDRCPAGKALRR